MSIKVILASVLLVLYCFIPPNSNAATMPGCLGIGTHEYELIKVDTWGDFTTYISQRRTGAWKKEILVVSENGTMENVVDSLFSSLSRDFGINFAPSVKADVLKARYLLTVRSPIAEETNISYSFIKPEENKILFTAAPEAPADIRFDTTNATLETKKSFPSVVYSEFKQQQIRPLRTKIVIQSEITNDRYRPDERSHAHGHMLSELVDRIKTLDSIGDRNISEVNDPKMRSALKKVNSFLEQINVPRGESLELRVGNVAVSVRHSEDGRTIEYALEGPPSEISDSSPVVDSLQNHLNF